MMPETITTKLVPNMKDTTDEIFSDSTNNISESSLGYWLGKKKNWEVSGINGRHN